MNYFMAVREEKRERGGGGGWWIEREEKERESGREGVEIFIMLLYKQLRLRKVFQGKF